MTFMHCNRPSSNHYTAYIKVDLKHFTLIIFKSLHLKVSLKFNLERFYNLFIDLFVK